MTIQFFILLMLSIPTLFIAARLLYGDWRESKRQKTIRRVLKGMEALGTTNNAALKDSDGLAYTPEFNGYNSYNPNESPSAIATSNEYNNNSRANSPGVGVQQQQLGSGSAFSSHITTIETKPFGSMPEGLKDTQLGKEIVAMAKEQESKRQYLRQWRKDHPRAVEFYDLKKIVKKYKAKNPNDERGQLRHLERELRIAEARAKFELKRLSVVRNRKGKK